MTYADEFRIGTQFQRHASALAVAVAVSLSTFVERERAPSGVEG